MARVLTGIGVGPIQTNATLSEGVQWPGGDGYMICEFINIVAKPVVTLQTKTKFNLTWIDTDIVFEDQLGGIKYFTLPRNIDLRIQVTGHPDVLLIAQVLVDPRRRTLA